ncbi:MAG: heavy-metal-associated domain-containing protein [Mycolicibacterium sp.]
MNMIHGTLVVEPADGSTSKIDAGGREVASAVGVGPSTEATVVTERVEFGVSNMSCASCVVNIESVIGELAGVDNVEVSFGTERTTVDFDPSQIAATEIQAAAGNAGYRLTPRTRRERPTPKTLKPPSAAPRSRTCPGGWCSVRPLPLRWWWSWRWTCSALGWVPEFMVNPWFSNASRCYTASHAGNGRSGRVLSDFARGADEHHAAKMLFDSPGPA